MQPVALMLVFFRGFFLFFFVFYFKNKAPQFRKTSGQKSTF